MEWKGCSDEMQSPVWGWKAEGGKLIPVMTDKSSAPNAPIQMIHCNCLERFNTCKKHGLECTSACRHCQDGNCDNMTNDPVIDNDNDDVDEAL